MFLFVGFVGVFNFFFYYGQISFKKGCQCLKFIFSLTQMTEEQGAFQEKSTKGVYKIQLKDYFYLQCVLEGIRKHNN